MMMLSIFGQQQGQVFRVVYTGQDGQAHSRIACPNHIPSQGEKQLARIDVSDDTDLFCERCANQPREVL